MVTCPLLCMSGLQLARCLAKVRASCNATGRLVFSVELECELMGRDAVWGNKMKPVHENVMNVIYLWIYSFGHIMLCGHKPLTLTSHLYSYSKLKMDRNVRRETCTCQTHMHTHVTTMYGWPSATPLHSRALVFLKLIIFSTIDNIPG